MQRNSISTVDGRPRARRDGDEGRRSRASAAVIPAVVFGLCLALGAFALPFGRSASADDTAASAGPIPSAR